MDGFAGVAGFKGPVPSPRGPNAPQISGYTVGLGGLGAGSPRRSSRSAVAVAAAAAAPALGSSMTVASSPRRQPTIGAEIRADMAMAGTRNAPAAYSPRHSVAATVAGARGRWSNLIENADDEVRSIMTPDAQPAFGGLDDVKDDCGFGDLGLDEHERAVLEQSLRRQAKIEHKLSRMQAQEKKKASSKGGSSRRCECERERELDLSGGTVGPESFAAAAAGASPRHSRRERGVMKPRVSGRSGTADTEVSQWGNEVAQVSGLPAVRGASVTPTNEMEDGPDTPRVHKASAPSSARRPNESPRGGSNRRRRRRRERREKRAEEEVSDDDTESRTQHNELLNESAGPANDLSDMDKLEKLRLALAQMENGEEGEGGAATEKVVGDVAAENPAEARAAAAAAAVADAKFKAQAAVKEAMRLAQTEAEAVVAAKRKAALRAELQGLKLGQLCTRATKEGVDATQLEEAQDSDTPKEAVISLLLKTAAKPEPEPEPEPAAATPQKADDNAEEGYVDGSPAASSPSSSVMEPGGSADGDDAKTNESGPSGGAGRRKQAVQLGCPGCSTEFKAHAPVKQKQTRKCRCGGCGEALTVGYCPGCAELTAWNAAARTHQNASCSSCFAVFHVAKCPGCKEIAAHVGTHDAAEFSLSKPVPTAAGGLSPHTRAQVPGSATEKAQSSGLVCESCSLRFFECGCPACGVWSAHPARVLTTGGRKGPELECEGCSYRFKYSITKKSGGVGKDPFSSSSSEDIDARNSASRNIGESDGDVR